MFTIKDKKKVEDIQTPTAKKNIITRHQKFGQYITVNGCNGSSNLGQLTVAVANAIRDRVPNAFVDCPYALFADVEGSAQVILHADYRIVFDGCKSRCLTKALEGLGVNVTLSYAMDEDFGFEKIPQPATYSQEQVQIVVDKVLSDLREKGLIKEKFSQEETKKHFSYDQKN